MLAGTRRSRRTRLQRRTPSLLMIAFPDLVPIRERFYHMIVTVEVEIYGSEMITLAVRNVQPAVPTHEAYLVIFK